MLHRIVRSDAEIERRRLASGSRQEARLAQERLRQIELDIDDASRGLRRARSQLQSARDQLEELEDRHWALLSQYNVKQAGDQITDALKELEDLEPAARLEENSKDMPLPSPEAEKKTADTPNTDSATTSSSPLFSSAERDVKQNMGSSSVDMSGSVTRSIASDGDSAAM